MYETAPWDWNLFTWHLFQVLVYGAIGFGLFAVAYLVIDKLTPFSFSKELLENKNVALGVVLGAVFIGIAIILAAAIRG